MGKPVIADLFCGAGGAARGLQQAGFRVIGFDIKPQPRYAGDEFHQADALEVDLSGFDAVWASPPCQDASVASAIHRGKGKVYPKLIPPTRAKLIAAGCPYIIENVPGAKLEYMQLCGLMFGLKVFRHRWFESNVLLMNLPHIAHKGHKVGVDMFSIAGGAGRWKSWGTVHRNVSKGTAAEWREAMGIDWMTRAELTQAIPPAYSEFLGRQLMKAIVNKAMVL